MTLWLFGDSIFRGAALGRFPDEHSPAQIVAEPLWPLRSPAAVMNLMLGEEVVRHGGVTRLPGGVDKAAAALRRRFGPGGIGPSDTVVFLDVGPHAGDPDRHEAQWRTLRRAASGEHPVRLLMCGGFDHGARGKRMCQHDLVFGARSHNDAVRAAAEAEVDEAGATSFLDLSGPLNAHHHSMAERFSVGAYRPDGVHLNVWGQVRLCALVLAAAFPDRPLSATALLAFASGHWPAMGAGSRSDAAAMMRLSLAAGGPGAMVAA